MNNITAIVAVALGSLIAVVAIVLFHPGDNSVLITVIFASAVPTIAGLVGFVKSQENSADLQVAKEKLATTDRKMNELQITVDGRLTQLLEARTDAAHSAGILSGQQDERYRAALIAQAPPPIEAIVPPIGTPIVEPPSEPRAGPGEQH